MDMANHPVVPGQHVTNARAVSSLFANVPHPDADWAERNPDRALAFLYVSPRPCEALDRLMKI